MKKFILLLVVLFGTLSVKAQIDTIQFGIEHRDSTYYYHCSFDEYMSKLQWHSSIGRWNKPLIMAKPFYTDVPLKIIGVAGLVNIQHHPTEYMYDTVPEFFELYEATDTSFEKLASVRWDTITPTKCMYFEHNNPYCPPVYPIYEAYFDSARTVYDSFYVGFTMYNNVPFLEPDGYGNMVYVGHDPKTFPTIISIESFFGDSSSLPCMSHIRVKYLPVEGYYYEDDYVYQDTGNAILDTTVWYLDNQRTRTYFLMFPIFDTTGYYRDTCADVSNFSIVTDTESATLSWGSASDHIGWDIAYGEEGTPLESCTIINTTSNVYWLPDLDSAQWYVAYVRALCDDNKYSNWSDSIRFYITGDTTTVNIRNTVLENYTHIIPNPASDMVNIFSSFSIRKVEVYSLKGVKVKEEEVKAASIKMDISNLPKGTYLVKVYTLKGVATKKLIIN